MSGVVAGVFKPRLYSDDSDMELNARGLMVRRFYGEMYARTVHDTGRYRHLELMGHQLVAGPLAPPAGLDPAATTAAALRTGLLDTYRKRNSHSVERVARRQLNRRLNLSNVLVGEERLKSTMTSSSKQRDSSCCTSRAVSMPPPEGRKVCPFFIGLLVP